MKIVIAADTAAAHLNGVDLLASAQRCDHDAVLFDHPASRDPTLELPTLVRAHGAEFVLVVSPTREDPATLDVLRRLGAKTVVWIDEPDAADRPWMKARRRWIATAADRVWVTREHMRADFVDRRGRIADHAARPEIQESFDAQLRQLESSSLA